MRRSRAGRDALLDPMGSRIWDFDRSVENVERIIEGLPMAMLLIRCECGTPSIAAMNGCAVDLFGHSRGALVGRDLDAILPDSVFGATALIPGEPKSDGSRVVETTLVRAGGGRFVARMHAIAIEGDDGATFVLTVQDITSELRGRKRLAAADAERQRIAHEFHDGLVQDLAAIRLRAALWREWIEADPVRLRAELDRLSDELDAEIDVARRAIFDIRPAELSDFGFECALRDVSSALAERYGFEMHLEIAGSIEALPVALELPLLRMVQEGLVNIGQHAEAHTTHVHLDLRHTDRVLLEVRDDGQGFGPRALNDALERGHFGVLHLSERAEAAGGRMHIEGTPGKGTAVRIELPLSTTR